MEQLIQENISLKKFNTFGLEISTRWFVPADNLEKIRNSLIENHGQPLMVLGGGSNVLFTKDFEGLVLHIQTKGIEKKKEDEDFVWVKVQAGEIWHTFVQYCIDQGYGGVENLSLIPGTVGAAPMQNIGAYGVEVKDVIEQVEVMDRRTGELKELDAKECAFGYRESIFKKEAKDHYVITAVLFRLSKKPLFNITYGAIKDTLEQMGIKELSIKSISEAVCSIRRSKLPDPAEIGNAGSFFKNPEITKAQYQALVLQYPDMPSYTVSETSVKIPAGWMIEKAGWKGKRVGQVGVHPKQALVLVNYGHGRGQDILDLSKEIQQDILHQFGISLSPEINIV